MSGNVPPSPGGTVKKTVIKAVRPHQTRPGPRDVQDGAQLAKEVKGALQRVRKTAENWRTGMAGLATLITATLLFKGHDTISDYAGSTAFALGALVLGSLVFAVVSLWLFLTAAYGRLRPTSAQSILDAGGVDLHNIELATTALRDLRIARGLSLASSAFLAAALILSWYGPAAKQPSNQVKIVIASEAPPRTETPLCGELKALAGDAAVIQVDGEPNPRRFRTDRLVSFKIVPSC